MNVIQQISIASWAVIKETHGNIIWLNTATCFRISSKPQNDHQYPNSYPVIPNSLPITFLYYNGGTFNLLKFKYENEYINTIVDNIPYYYIWNIQIYVLFNTFRNGD